MTVLGALREEIIDAHRGRAELLKWKLILVAALGTVGLGFNVEPWKRADITMEPEKVLSTYLLLCLIPLICVYVDSLCQHLYLRTIVIGTFFRNYHNRKGSDIDWFCEYEAFCEMTRREQVKRNSIKERIVLFLEELGSANFSNIIGLFFGKNTKIKPFSLEDLAMEWATIFLSSAVLVFAISLWRNMESLCGGPIRTCNKSALGSIDLHLIPIFIFFSGTIGIILSMYIKKQFKRKSAQLSSSAESFNQEITDSRKKFSKCAESNRRGIVMTEFGKYQVNNLVIEKLIRSEYGGNSLTAAWQFLIAQDTLKFVTTNQLFPAASTADSENTGYKYVWVRDNVYVAYAHYIMGEYNTAVQTILGLMTYFQKFSFRFTNIIDDPNLKEQVMQRPNIRFNGETLEEIDEDWEHAQNDALGYFLWLYSTLAAQPETESLIAIDEPSAEMLSKFVLYFNAIRYWEDPDSGHWEEGRKISASSMGPVIAGLEALKSLVLSNRLTLDVSSVSEDPEAFISQLIEKGKAALNEILPWECRTPENKRRYDAALLYLIFPLKVVTKSQAETILADVKEALTGDYGIARYSYDSFWCRDFQDLDKSIQTAKYTGREAWLEEHNRAVKRGEEAQWCIFDPIISAIYGEWFKESDDDKYLELQTFHLNRALGQITGEGNTVDAGAGNNEPVDIPAYRCPALYYIQHDDYVPNVSTPLLWTQANLCIALKLMERSLSQI
mgnify:FL=1